jgi:hypothetical protein
VRTLVPEAYDVRIVLESDDESTTQRDPRFAEPMSEHEALGAYLETLDETPAERDELMRLGRELIDEVLA